MELFENKIILKPNEKNLKICKIFAYIIIFLLVILSIFINYFMKDMLIIKIIFTLFPIIFSIFIILFTRQKIEIENFIIYKFNLFNKKKKIGNVSEITSFCESDTTIYVMKNNKLFFSFIIYGEKDNPKFYKYLKDNYIESINIKGYKFISLIIYLYAFMVFISLLQENFPKGSICIIIMTFLFLIYGLDQNIKQFQIINDQIFYKRLFIKKKFNISNLTKIEYRKVNFRSRVYIITGFNNKIKLFKFENVTPKNLKTIINIAKNFKIKMSKKD